MTTDSPPTTPDTPMNNAPAPAEQAAQPGNAPAPAEQAAQPGNTDKSQTAPRNPNHGPSKKVLAARQAAKHIAEELKEPNVPGITRVVLACGEEQARTWLQETQAIEEQGGMPTNDGARRRSPGGVYFKLVKEYLFHNDFEKLKAIFRPPTGTGKPKPKKKGGAARPGGVPWSTRAEAMQEMKQAFRERGVAHTVKVTLVGKLGKTIEKHGYTLAMMSSRPRLQALPKGIPVPDKAPETQYVIYIGSKQWRKVKEAVKNPDDTVIIEGTQFWDSDYESIAVFVTNITTKLTQQAVREAQRQAAQTEN